MFVDARSIPDGTVLEADLCIVGAGAAGITIARAFVASGLRVALVEGGAQEIEQDSQELYAATEIGQPYPDLSVCRLRYFGGTTNHWAGWCLPLDAIDFEAREGLPYRGWPFDRAHLDPWYRRAHSVVQIGPYDYSPSAWGIREPAIPAPFNGPRFVTKVLQASPPTRFGPVYEAELRAAPRLTVYLHANALGFSTDATGREVQTLSIGTLSGRRLSLRARVFVAATGGVENARLLLLSGRPDGNGLGNAHDLVGRFFMSHMEFVGGTIAVSDPYAYFDFSYDFNATTGRKRPFVSFVGPSQEAMRELFLVNGRFTWEYHFGQVLDTINASRRLIGRGGHGDTFADILTVIRDLDGLAGVAARKALFGQGLPVEFLKVRCHLEQLPNPASRVTLGDERDPFGNRRIVMDWRPAAADKRNSNRLLHLLGTEVGRAGFGRLRSALAEDDTTWPDDMVGNAHQMGTTRMHRDPKLGVVDENCRVHDVANLYVAGSSVFPTSGGGNPTLTIVALALRLADHLKERLA